MLASAIDTIPIPQGKWHGEWGMEHGSAAFPKIAIVASKDVIGNTIASVISDAFGRALDMG